MGPANRLLKPKPQLHLGSFLQFELRRLQVTLLTPSYLFPLHHDVISYRYAQYVQNGCSGYLPKLTETTS